VKPFLDVLFPTEREYLIAAIRRDIESERNKAALCPEWELHHLRNVRLSVRLLEALGYREEDAGPPQSRHRQYGQIE
jgi:hypothetical protein